MKRTFSGQGTFPLYETAYEHDSCGVGLVVDIEGAPSRRIVELALGGLVNLTHRGGVGADERTGDGAGILTQLPHELFVRAFRFRCGVRAGRIWCRYHFPAE